jgi:hypothetical protein
MAGKDELVSTETEATTGTTASARLPETTEEFAYRAVDTIGKFDRLDQDDARSAAMSLRNLLLERYGDTPVTEAVLRRRLTDGIRRTLNKAGDSREALRARKAIEAIDPAEWDVIVAFLAWEIAYSLNLPTGE